MLALQALCLECTEADIFFGQNQLSSKKRGAPDIPVRVRKTDQLFLAGSDLYRIKCRLASTDPSCRMETERLFVPLSPSLSFCRKQGPESARGTGWHSHWTGGGTDGVDAPSPCADPDLYMRHNLQSLTLSYPRGFPTRRDGNLSVRKHAPTFFFWRHFLATQNDRFTKTGSGQTNIGKALKKRDVFPAGHSWQPSVPRPRQLQWPHGGCGG